MFATLAPMSGALTLATCDMWKLHDASNNPLVLALGRHTELRPAKVAHADVVLYSVFGQQHQALRRTAVAMSVQPFLPDARYAQWTADWRHHPSDHHLRYPYWAMQLLSPSGATLVSASHAGLAGMSAPPRRASATSSTRTASARCATRSSQHFTIANPLTHWVGCSAMPRMHG